MELILYNTNDTANTLNKDLTELVTLDINFKQGQNMFNPTLVLTKKNIPIKANYCKLGTKYYFVNSTYEYHTDYLILNLYEDVLQTYKNDILNSETDVISKSKIDYNTTVSTTNRVVDDIIKSDVKLDENESIIVQTNGTTDKPINL